MAKGGRPRKDPLHLRSIRVTVRLTPAEHSQLRLLASLHQMRACSYLRDAALSRPLPEPRPSINDAAYRELCRISSNLNQLTHLAHAGQPYLGIFSAIRSLSDNLASIKEALRPIRRRRLRRQVRVNPENR